MRTLCALLAGAASLGGFGCDPPASESGGKKSSSICAAECLPVPQGIKGLTFGMSFERASEALHGAKMLHPHPSHHTRIAPSKPNAPEYQAIPVKLRHSALRKARQALPGKMVKVKTTLGTEPALCTLSFAIRDGLSHIACEITSTKTKKHHDRVFEAIRTRLEKRHGAAEVAGNLLSWRDEHARLLLFSRGRAIVLTNSAAAHIALISELRDKATKVYRAKLDAYLAETRAAEAARAAKAKKAAQAWDRDLSPAAEK